MGDEKDILRRKFEPFTDYRPAGERAGRSQALWNETLEQAQRTREAIEKRLEPFTEEAGVKIKEFAAIIEDAASKSSKEARSFIAKTLAAVADRIKPD